MRFARRFVRAISLGTRTRPFSTRFTAGSKAALRDGHLAIADATNLITENREQFHLIAHAAGAMPRTVYCAAPADVIERRLARKLSGYAESFGSTADMEIHRRMASNDAPPSEPHFAVTPDTLDAAIAEMRSWALSLLGDDR